MDQSDGKTKKPIVNSDVVLTALWSYCFLQPVHKKSDEGELPFAALGLRLSRNTVRHRQQPVTNVIGRQVNRLCLTS